MALLSLLWFACADAPQDGASTADTGAPSSDTGAPDTGTPDACPPDVVPLAISACAESTSAPAEDEHSGTALLTEVGPALEAIPDSAPLFGFDACDSTFPHQVRLVDDAGDIWTFGWLVEGGLDGESTAALLPGTDLGFTVAIRRDEKSGHDLALVLADAVGPVLLFERSLLLTEAQRGMSAEVDPSVTCTEGTYEHFGVTYAWAAGSVTLQSGQSTTVPLPGRELFLLQGSAVEATGCDDGCTSVESMAWAEVP